jgi:hypothetical protein
VGANDVATSYGDLRHPWRDSNITCCWTNWHHVSPHGKAPQEGRVFCVLCHVSPITLQYCRLRLKERSTLEWLLQFEIFCFHYFQKPYLERDKTFCVNVERYNKTLPLEEKLNKITVSFLWNNFGNHLLRSCCRYEDECCHDVSLKGWQVFGLCALHLTW